ncbi:hypothetical protein BDA96_01G235000 [Sorghum bicolor]|uniref:Uncharacterized protein n=1 Tax=Sorghum bicolor TaxID=4558 RepID=A0A921S0E8_SORBI|nr:hypothetical protein BDA96_01G235000 [Sorghum bicolor]
MLYHTLVFQPRSEPDFCPNAPSTPVSAPPHRSSLSPLRRRRHWRDEVGEQGAPPPPPPPPPPPSSRSVLAGDKGNIGTG